MNTESYGVDTRPSPYLPAKPSLLFRLLPVRTGDKHTFPGSHSTSLLNVMYFGLGATTLATAPIRHNLILETLKCLVRAQQDYLLFCFFPLGNIRE